MLLVYEYLIKNNAQFFLSIIYLVEILKVPFLISQPEY